jgi:hypothetical protein
VCNATADNIFSELWKENIINVIVIIPTPDVCEVDMNTASGQEFVPVLQLCTWFPYQPPDACAQTTNAILLDHWVANAKGEGRFVNNSYLFPQKVPNDLPLGIMVKDPIIDADNNTSYGDGLEIRLFNVLKNAVCLCICPLHPAIKGEECL